MNTPMIIDALAAVQLAILDNESQIESLDRAIGDGDHFINVRRGCEVLVAMKASGMCGSDLHGYRAPRAERQKREPNIGGHEPCGVVVARGSSVSES